MMTSRFVEIATLSLAAVPAISVVYSGVHHSRQWSSAEWKGEYMPATGVAGAGLVDSRLTLTAQVVGRDTVLATPADMSAAPFQRAVWTIRA